MIHHGARRIDDDAARRLIVDSFFAIGVGYGKHLRAGDRRALGVCLRHTWQNLAEIRRRVFKRRRPFHIWRLVEFWHGVIVGVRSGLDVPAIPTVAA